MNFVLKCLNTEPSEHLESSLRKVISYIGRQKANVYSVLVTNENIESSREEIERNIEWIVKAAAGKLYPTSGIHAERVPSFEEHGADVPQDIASHINILQLIFSLLLVNPSYLIRIYSVFVSDAARVLRRIAKKSIANRNPVNASNGDIYRSANAKAMRQEMSSEVLDHSIQHPERFIDLVFDVYGDLSLPFNEHRFLMLCKHILQEEVQSIANRTHGNLALFMSRFASGKTVFCNLVKRYLQQPHITAKAAKLLSSHLVGCLTELENGALTWGSILEKRRQYIERAREIYVSEAAERGKKNTYGANDEDGDGIPDEVEIGEGGRTSLDATKLLISKFVMDNLFVPIIINPRAHGIINEDTKSVSSSGASSAHGKKASSDSGQMKKMKQKTNEKNNGQTKQIKGQHVSTGYLVAANLEILSDTLRHMASVLDFNHKARWLQQLTESVRMSRIDSINWARSIINLGGQYDIDSMLVNDMYLAHIQPPEVVCAVGLSRIKYMRYCFSERPDVLMSSSNDAMHHLMFAPLGIGLINSTECLKAAQKFPRECYSADDKHEVGNGRPERVSLNLRLQTRFLTKKSCAPYIQLQLLVDSHKDISRNGSTYADGLTMGKGKMLSQNGFASKTMTEQNEKIPRAEPSRRWGDRIAEDEESMYSGGQTAALSTSTGDSNTSGTVSIGDLYIDVASGVPLPSFLSSSDSVPVDASSEVDNLMPFLDGGDQESELYEDGRIAFREVIRSMDSLPNSVEEVVPAILEYIQKQQNLPLEIRDWTKATRFQLAFEFITNKNSGSGHKGSAVKTGTQRSGTEGSGAGAMLMQSVNQLMNLLCEFLDEIEKRKRLAEKLRKEVVRLNDLNARALAWERQLNRELESAQVYLCELLCSQNLFDSKTGDKSFTSKNQMAKDALIMRGVVKKGDLTDPHALLKELQSQYSKFLLSIVFEFLLCYILPLTNFRSIMTNYIDYKAKTKGASFTTSKGAFRAYTLLELLKAAIN
eukprot:g2604.t1